MCLFYIIFIKININIYLLLWIFQEKIREEQQFDDDREMFSDQNVPAGGQVTSYERQNIKRVTSTDLKRQPEESTSQLHSRHSYSARLKPRNISPTDSPQKTPNSTQSSDYDTALSSQSPVLDSFKKKQRRANEEVPRQTRENQKELSDVNKSLNVLADTANIPFRPVSHVLRTRYTQCHQKTQQRTLAQLRYYTMVVAKLLNPASADELYNAAYVEQPNINISQLASTEFGNLILFYKATVLAIVSFLFMYTFFIYCKVFFNTVFHLLIFSIT